MVGYGTRTGHIMQSGINLTSTTVEVKQARIFHVRTMTAENNVNRSVIKWEPSKFQKVLL